MFLLIKTIQIDRLKTTVLHIKINVILIMLISFIKNNNSSYNNTTLSMD